MTETAGLIMDGLGSHSARKGMAVTASLSQAGSIVGAAFLRRLELNPPKGPSHCLAPVSNGNAVTAVSADTPGVSAQRPSVPGYEILKELGRGGMGVVYQARQLGLNRLVALKMILRGVHSDARDIARFRAEGEAVARLQHSHIVQIYEVGEAEGTPFLSLEFVDGASLAGVLNGAPQPPAAAAKLVQVLAEAMQYSHERGILHRDLKPSNILLRTADGPAPKENSQSPIVNLQSAIPKITDFGLAKRLNADGPTITGAILGTPSYMPPEQASGEVSAIGPAADIYALGAILYEMLTGRPPFRAFSTTLTLWQVVHEDPVPPGRLRPHLPPDLETICLTCLHKDPRRRYANAQKLADDLHAYLAGLPIAARPAGPGERLMGWFRIHPAAALLAGVGGMGLLGVVVGLWLQSALAVGALAVVSLCLGAWWYSVRLERALNEVRQQNLLYQPTVERMYVLLKTVHRLLAAPSLDQRLRILGEAAARLVSAERATIFLIDAAAGQLRSKLALGEDETEIRLPIGSGIAGSVALTGKVINLSDPYGDARFNPEVDRRTGFTTRNLLTVPMTDATGRRLGVFQVLNKRGGPFDSEDVEILSQLALSASILVLPF